MQREAFEVLSDRGHHVVKQKWNSARAAVIEIVRKLARDEETIYELAHSEAHKEGFSHVKGAQFWKGRNGKTVYFSIRKIA